MVYNFQGLCKFGALNTLCFVINLVFVVKHNFLGTVPGNVEPCTADCKLYFRKARVAAACGADSKGPGEETPSTGGCWGGGGD